MRVLSNRSTGKMGYALASAGVAAGWSVTLVSGPTGLAAPPGVDRRSVETGRQMRDAVLGTWQACDLVVMAAAVSDFRPATTSSAGKLHRGPDAKDGDPGPSIALVANPDILAELGRTRVGKRPFIVGFAAQAVTAGGQLLEQARAKLLRKGCDLLVANDILEPGAGFGGDENRVWLLAPSGPAVEIGPASKADVAAVLWRHFEKALTSLPLNNASEGK